MKLGNPLIAQPFESLFRNLRLRHGKIPKHNLLKTWKDTKYWKNKFYQNNYCTNKLSFT